MNYNKIFKELTKLYNPYGFANQHSRDPYKVLVACILSLRTRDAVTDKAAETLFKKAKTPKQMLKLTTKQIEKLIYPAGFYKTKARTIRNISKTLIKDYNSKVPDTIEELLNLKGVGRKTANIVITFAYNKPGIAVDTHVHRISNRLGIVKTSEPDLTEEELRKTLPKRYWIPINNLLVRFGQNICKPIKPNCKECPITKQCNHFKNL